jgi:glycerol-3-phosphate acyltransferase PlsY
LALVLAVILFITHHENIHRLWLGQEPRIGANKKDA